MILFSNCIGLLSNEHLKLSIYKINLLTILLEFILTVYLILRLKTPPSPQPQNTFSILITMFRLVQNKLFYNLNQVFLNSVFIS